MFFSLYSRKMTQPHNNEKDKARMCVCACVFLYFLGVFHLFLLDYYSDFLFYRLKFHRRHHQHQLKSAFCISFI